MGETQYPDIGEIAYATTFSILERIDVGETCPPGRYGLVPRTFSILERIDVGETHQRANIWRTLYGPFSILERIDVGETRASRGVRYGTCRLSVSSNGSTWVKQPGGSARYSGAVWLSVSSNGSTWVKHAMIEQRQQ